jgi:predicted nucleic acid-binding protein
MAVLLDTNILLRLAQPESAHAPIAERALLALRASQKDLQITSQNLIEFWAVAIRPMQGWVLRCWCMERRAS